jgi:hypothetical protein
MKDLIEQTAEQMDEIKRRALLFCVDNKCGSALILIEAAMMIGASVVMEQEGADMNRESEAIIQLAAWQEAFGTNQLTHALARLQKAERAARELNETKPHPMIPMPCCERPETRTSKCFTPQ